MDIYTENFKVTLPDVGENNSITNKGFLRIFQEIGCIHSSLFGRGLNDSKKTGLFWVILNWKLEVFSRPKWNETLKVSTWCTKHTHIYIYRDFKVYDSSNNVVAVATSRWILFDFNKKQVFKITEDFKDNYCDFVDDNVFSSKMCEKLQEPGNSKVAGEYTIQKRDIDSNHHVNNLNYLDFAYELLPKNAEFKNIEIMYKNEARLGDTMKLYYGEKDCAIFVTMKNCVDDKLHCIVKLQSV